MAAADRRLWPLAGRTLTGRPARRTTRRERELAVVWLQRPLEVAADFTLCGARCARQTRTEVRTREKSPICLPRAPGSSLLIPTGQGHDVTMCVRPQEKCHPDLGRLGCTDLSVGCSATAGPTIQLANVRNCVRCARMSLSRSRASADVAARRGNLLAQVPNKPCLIARPVEC